MKMNIDSLTHHLKRKIEINLRTLNYKSNKTGTIIIGKMSRKGNEVVFDVI